MVAGYINCQPFDIIDELTIRQGQVRFSAFLEFGLEIHGATLTPFDALVCRVHF